jgi:zinc/manganese transport system ATP-binding protein
MTAQIKFRNVTLGYDRHPAVHHLNGEVAPGALMAVIGPNGAGKSTLFRGVAGILKPLSGAIGLGGLDSRDIAYLPQSVDIDRSFPISVFDFVGSGLWRSTGPFGGIGKAAREKILAALAAVGLNGFENRSIGTLSGGQMQRMLFARLLLQDARVIVLDEPFNAIDAKTCGDLIALIRQWHGERRTVLTALHDLEIRHAWLEGGPRLAGAFEQAGMIDEVVGYLAPALLGAGSAAVEDIGVATIAAIHRLAIRDVTRLGPDVRIIARPEQEEG